MRKWKKPKKKLLPMGTWVKYKPQSQKGYSIDAVIVGYPTYVCKRGDDGTYILELENTGLVIAWDSEIE